MIEAFSIAGEQFIAKKLADLRVETLDALPVALRRQLRKEKLRIDLVAVYGEGFQFDENGNPVEQGIGTPNNMTLTAVRAFETSNDCTLPKNSEHLALIKKQYAACQERDRKARALKEAAELEELQEARREIEGE
jgi:hypothetical protein